MNPEGWTGIEEKAIVEGFLTLITVLEELGKVKIGNPEG